MNKVFIIHSVWTYDGCVDDFANCYEDHIEAIFDSEDKAINYIQEQLKPMIDFRSEVLEAKSKINKDECCVEKCRKGCIACEDTIDLDILPTKEEIMEHKEVIYLTEHGEESSYTYESMDVL